MIEREFWALLLVIFSARIGEFRVVIAAQYRHVLNVLVCRVTMDRSSK